MELEYAGAYQLNAALDRLLFMERLPPAITSTRKFDKHGDWHYFFTMPRVAFWMLIDKSRVEKFTKAYWYDDRS